MQLISSGFINKQPIPIKYTFDGENINPPLQIKEIPEGTKSLALICEDPDASMGTWVHWMMWNIDPKTEIIPEGTSPKNAVEGITDFAKPGYGGPCPPPSKPHRYFFKLFALDTLIDINYFDRAEVLERAMEGHILAKAELMGTYCRK